MSDDKAKTSASDAGETKGVRCPSCGCAHAPVYKTRDHDSQIVRIRECRHCGRRFTTRERVG